jgi:hypothetical protein
MAVEENQVDEAPLISDEPLSCEAPREMGPTASNSRTVISDWLASIKQDFKVYVDCFLKHEYVTLELISQLSMADLVDVLSIPVGDAWLIRK